ncbi:MAG: MazG nucleotide pyrophosphohydrolase domain-containing protein [Dehalococcoidia bacterium]
MADGPPGAPTLIAIMDALGLAPHELQTFDPAYSRFDAQRPLLVLDEQFVAARPLLGDRYPARAPARAVVRGAVRDGVAVADLPEDADAWLLPALPPEQDSRALAGLRGVMERLYAPDGCPWDREQTHESLRRYFLDEAYELVDAIDHGDVRGLEEEIGDVLAHLFMQTALAQLAGTFTVEDVVAHASAKFVRRHPHVFGDEAAGSQEALLDRWEQIKAAERAQRGEAAGAEAPEGALDSVPAAAPALQRASALIGRALRAGVTPDRAPRRARSLSRWWMRCRRSRTRLRSGRSCGASSVLRARRTSTPRRGCARRAPASSRRLRRWSARRVPAGTDRPRSAQTPCRRHGRR